jgi:ligand-binding SRPBCC domain-containing protein
MVSLQNVRIVRAPIERCFDLARSVEAHLSGNVHSGEATVAAAGVTSGLLALGDRVTWRGRHFGIRWSLTAEISAMDRPAWFQVVMIRGPFRFMRHDHFFRSLPGGKTELRNVYAFAAPLAVLGRVAEVTFLRRYMAGLLRERNEVIREIAESADWPRYLNP